MLCVSRKCGGRACVQEEARQRYRPWAKTTLRDIGGATSWALKPWSSKVGIERSSTAGAQVVAESPSTATSAPARRFEVSRSKLIFVDPCPDRKHKSLICVFGRTCRSAVALGELRDTTCRCTLNCDMLSSTLRRPTQARRFRMRVHIDSHDSLRKAVACLQDGCRSRDGVCSRWSMELSKCYPLHGPIKCASPGISRALCSDISQFAALLCQ